MARVACLLLTSLLLMACAPHGEALGGTRAGPLFEDTFESVAVLLAAEDVAATRETLLEVLIPATDAHHDALLAAVRAAERLDAEHLALVLDAVYLPASWRVGESGVVMTVNGKRVRDAGPGVGGGPYAGVMDQLLREGLGKVVPLAPRAAGRLLGRAQSAAVVRELAQRHVLSTDDGTHEWLEHLLDGVAGSAWLAALVVDALVPAGHVTSARVSIAFDALPFDADREAFVSAHLARVQACGIDQLLAFIEGMSFDEGRAAIVVMGAPVVEPFGCDRLVDVLGTLSFDEGRCDAVHALANAGRLTLEPAGIVPVVRGVSFDAGRLDVLRVLQPHMPDLGAHEFGRLLASFSFDESRLDVVALLAPRLPVFSAAEKSELLGAFGFDSSREEAERLLGSGH